MKVMQASTVPLAMTQNDFVYFVQQWQISICDRRPCLKPARPVFSILGLWPSSYTGQLLSNCNNGSRFNQQKISDLLIKLDAEWPSLLHEDNIMFWKEEWERHGICTETKLNQHAFFQAALKLKQKYKLTEILQERGIYPFGNVYGLDSISNAITAMTGHRPQIQCNLFKQIPQLSQIFLCFDTTATKIIDCPQRRRCQHDAVMFPYTLGS
ncbi:Ribonuclease [Quillaja saponaria]|uniref:Ribonuclease n=1 Tax=Quillaja saponaria TaxID=32244 RepID=A0AAD7Q3V4_QUISA|nr:Ribonuclease [Quillaja saponaria]